MSTTVPAKDALASAAWGAARRAADALLAQRQPAGWWRGELTADTTLESDFVLVELWRHPPVSGRWEPPTRKLVDKAVESILARQLPDGGFNIYPGGPAEVSATIKAYFALKLAGVRPDEARMVKARERILELGGLQAANSYVKINLSLFNLYPREYCPTIPVEIMMLPGNFIYQMSSWTRAIVIPLSIVQALNPGRPVPAGFSLAELYVPGRGLEFARNGHRSAWHALFRRVDALLKLWEKHGPRAVRETAIRRAEQWILERTRYSDGLGAIYPPMMYTIMALDLLGYPPDHPDRAEAERQFFKLMVDDGERFFFQPCFSPVWDTAIASFALGASGAVPLEALRPAADWLLAKEVRRKGDWAVKRPGVEPSGWFFEFANEHYPDIDDTFRPWTTGGGGAPGRGLAAGHAVVRWRLGGVRRRQQLGVSGQGPVRRSQRDARSHLPGHHRQGSGSALRVRFARRSSGGAPGSRLPGPDAETGRQLVRPLGGEPYLRDLPRAARVAGRRRRPQRSAHSSRR